MKKYMIPFLAFTLLLGTASCSDGEGGDETSNGHKIETREFSGSFDISKDDIKKEMAFNDSGDEGWLLDFKDQTTITVVASERTLDDVLDGLRDNSFKTYEVIEKKDNWAIYKMDEEGFGDEENTTEYFFTLVTPGPEGKQLLFEGNGENPLMGLKTEEEARELLKLAQSFKMN